MGALELRMRVLLKLPVVALLTIPVSSQEKGNHTVEVYYPSHPLYMLNPVC